MVSLHPESRVGADAFLRSGEQGRRRCPDAGRQCPAIDRSACCPLAEQFLRGDPLVGWNRMVSDEDRSKHLLEMLHAKFSDPKFQQAEFRVSFGTPAEVIAHFAEKEGVDLIMLPSHGRTGLARLMIG